MNVDHAEAEYSVWCEWVAPAGEIILEDSYRHVRVEPGDEVLMVRRGGAIVITDHRPKTVN